MATFTRKVLSGSTDGIGIDVSSTAGTTATMIHQGASTTTTIDEVFIYAQNNATADVSLVIEFGSSASTSMIRQDIPFRDGPTLVCPGLPLQGNATPKEITAWASTSNVISCFGYVNRIDQS